MPAALEIRGTFQYVHGIRDAAVFRHCAPPAGERVAGIRHRPDSVRTVTFGHIGIQYVAGNRFRQIGRIRFWRIPIFRKRDQWMAEPGAFVRPADGEWGNASQNIQGPGIITINMGLTRKFQIREKQFVEFRAEAFNLPNHLNPNNPVTAINNQNFGKILSAGDPRIIQLALKYVF